MKRVFALIGLGLTTLLLTGCFAIQQPQEISSTVVAPTIAPTVVPATSANTEIASTEVVANTVSADAAKLFSIDSARSEARFTINESLMGSPKTVVGVTSAVAGEVLLDLANANAAQVGEILVNSRGFITDNEFRNRAIANKILLTGSFEYVSFKPTAISGLENNLAVGKSYQAQITGDLTILNTTKPVTFDLTLTVNSEKELQGLATATIHYADFDVQIPFSPSVDSVEDTVMLELEFVAVAP